MVRLPVSRIPAIQVWLGMTPRLRAHHLAFAVIDLRPGQELRIWGVVGGVVRRLP